MIIDSGIAVSGLADMAVFVTVAMLPLLRYKPRFRFNESISGACEGMGGKAFAKLLRWKYRERHLPH